jgi:hypothetical protein
MDIRSLLSLPSGALSDQDQPEQTLLGSRASVQASKAVHHRTAGLALDDPFSECSVLSAVAHGAEPPSAVIADRTRDQTAGALR